MFTAADQEQIGARGSNLSEILNQISHFRKGFPFLKIVEAAGIGSGITRLSEKECTRLVTLYETKLGKGIVPVKFVPASGAASRMFQSLFSFQEEALTNDEAELLLGKEQHNNVRQFFDQLSKFAFYPSVLEKLGTLLDAEGKMKYVEILRTVLSPEGLNYGFLPKGLLDFHQYSDTSSRTPAEEHLVEGALYGTDARGTVRIHFTVSPEHLPFFKNKCETAAVVFGKRYEVQYDISFSEQKPSTDTIAVDENNEPFRTAEGKLFFRPGGHGALLENLNDLQADLIFVKNIDNVVPDRLKDETIKYKKALAGLLLEYQLQIFNYLHLLENPAQLAETQIEEMLQYLERELSTLPAVNAHLTDKQSRINYLFVKLNRPIRMCGMVKNEGEPGGGPFWAINPDGTTTLQVVESSQIDLKNPGQAAIAVRSTHFNPVDLVCGIRNYKGEKFSLPDFRDPETGFISSKSKDGKQLKAQELPGLWNGAMSDWITFFVEVPPITFNPVKTVNDLLRAEHQPL